MLMVKRLTVFDLPDLPRRQTGRLSKHFRSLLAYTGTEIEGSDGFDFEAYFQASIQAHLTDCSPFTIAKEFLILLLVMTESF